MASDQHVVVVGSGPAGLAAAAMLQSEAAHVTLLDRGNAVGMSWRMRYDGLRLNTVRWFSHLPGLRMPARMGRWVERDDFVAYLERYAAHHRLRLHGGVTATRIDRGSGGRRRWLVSTDRGTLEASGVVIATGAFDVPVMPDWPGLSRYRVDLCHASEYRRVEPYVGRSVLVIGAGASGLEIATLLADGGAEVVYLSARSCQNLFPREVRGMPLTAPPTAQRLPTAILDAAGTAIHRMLGRDWPSPLPRARAGLGTALRRDGREPLVADGVVEALRAGRITLVPGIEDFREHEVVLADGRTLRPSAVIAATGYTHGLNALAGHLGVLRSDGLPVAPDGGPIADAAGLAFIGFEPTVTGRLLQLARQARRAARTANPRAR